MLNFTAIDFETANGYRGSPCAVGLIRVRAGIIVDEQRWLIRPPEPVDYFAPFNTWVHGITEAMVADAPRWRDILPKLIDYIGDDVLIAHNAGFDIGVIRYACAVDNIQWPALRFVCSLVMSRHALSLPSYRLPFVTEALGCALGQHHDPLDDARAVTRVVAALARREKMSSLDDLAARLGVYIGHMSSGMYRGSVSVSTGGGARALIRQDVNPVADPGGYIYGRVVVFTGALMSMTRQIAWEECARVGALAELNMTKRTNVLVIGDLNPASLRPGETLSAKARKAFALQQKGQAIEVMTEDDFLRCVEGKPLSAVRDLVANSV